VDDIVRTLLSVVMLPAQQLPGCHFAQVYQRINEPQKVDYVEEWDDPAGLRPQLSCERFSRLLELVEMAAEAPEVEFRWISETYGMDYIATQRAVQAGGDVEPAPACRRPCRAGGEPSDAAAVRVDAPADLGVFRADRLTGGELRVKEE
jgi:quinol monooxygenase YgiN